MGGGNVSLTMKVLFQEHFFSLLQQFQQKRSAETDNGSIPTTMELVMAMDIGRLITATELATAMDTILAMAMELVMDMATGLGTVMDTTLGTAMAMELAMDMGLVTATELGMATELGTAMDTTLATATATAKLLTITNTFSLQPKLSIPMR